MRQEYKTKLIRLTEYIFGFPAWISGMLIIPFWPEHASLGSIAMLIGAIALARAATANNAKQT